MIVFAILTNWFATAWRYAAPPYCSASEPPLYTSAVAAPAPSYSPPYVAAGRRLTAALGATGDLTDLGPLGALGELLATA